MRKLKLEELNRISVEEFKLAPKNPVVVVLDNVRSMHNVGSVFRTSDAFRIEKIYLCGISPRPPHREIRKTAIGAEESVDWEYAADTVDVIGSLKDSGYEIISVEQAEGSTDLSQLAKPTGKCAIVLGHEVNGVSQEVINLSDHVVEIPQFGTKHSLNISVASGIVLYKLVIG